MPLHKLLERQLHRHAPGPEAVPAALEPLIRAIDAAYRQADDDRQLIQHSMEVMSTEHAERFLRLRAALDETDRTAEQNRQTLALVQSIIDSTSDGILVVDAAGHVVLSNRQFAELWSVPEHVIATARDERIVAWLLGQVENPADFSARLRAVYDDPEATSFDVIRFTDGRVIERSSAPHWVDGEAAGRLWTFRDVTDRHELERQFQQAQKLEAIGQLAGGIAHDFNNLITVIDAHCEFLEEDLASHHASAQEVREIRAAARRAAALTRQLLAFSRKQVLRPTVIELREVVTGIQSMIGRLIGEDITVRTLLAEEAVPVMADPGQLEQVLVNLVVNARDAMSSGGTLTIRVDVADVEPGTSAFHGEGHAPGRYAVVSVTDEGCGMPREMVDRIFDPFFTTKAVGKGTGLGLSTVYGIIQQSQGHIIVYSEVGLGTTFRVYLPIVVAAATPVVLPVERPRTPGNETILLVEDEEPLRRLTKRLLERHGYQVQEAQNGAHALELAADGTLAFDMVLTDVVMPQLGGPAFAEQLRSSHPDVPVLFMSGYIEDDIVRRGIVTGTERFLEKPFTTMALLVAVRQTLHPTASDERRIG